LVEADVLDGAADDHIPSTRLPGRWLGAADHAVDEARQRLGEHDLAAGRLHGQALAHHLADVRRPCPRRIHGELARDIALAGPDGADTAIAEIDVLHRRAEHDPGA